MTSKDELSQKQGVFERNRDGGGFLRSVRGNYSATTGDPFCPAAVAQRHGLRGGEILTATARPAKRAKGPRAPQVVTVDTICGRPAADWTEVPSIDELTVIDPQCRVRLETPDGPLSMRVLDLMTPIGLGQRALIAAPPRTGKTVLLQQIAAAVAHNCPDVYMMVLLIDERPEEVTEMRRSVHGEVVASSNDRDAANHVRLARLMIEGAKRRVEAGEHVFILLDSLTRLGRAFNTQVRGSGRIMSGGLDIRALEEPKSIFGAARNIEHGGSLTIVATALIETGSRMDEVIFNEFKGTGNTEIMLSHVLANKRLWPAVDLQLSGTRKEEILLSPAELEKSHAVRRGIVRFPPDRAMETLLDTMQRFPDNAAFVADKSGRHSF